jgi:hypothetical protein
MHWQAIAMPPSAAALLTKARAGRKGQGGAFSRTQEFVAGLYWFTTLPLETRLELVHAFTARPVTQRDRHLPGEHGDDTWCALAAQRARRGR